MVEKNNVTTLKKSPYLQTLSNHFYFYPTPINLNYAWSFGSLVGLFFGMQLVSGIFLAMHYTPHIDLAFTSVEHIMSDVNAGYIFRYFHANGASAVFIFMYLHIARNLYYQSYVARPRLWYTGLVIFLLMMATAFIGYVLPWGQMSFWGATVITSLVTAVPLVGEDIAYWVWGGFSINNATLNRFFSAHYLLPFIVTGIIMAHLIELHTDGSTDPMTLPVTPSKIRFHPYFSYKDAFIFTFCFALFGILVFYWPNLLGHSDNFIPANPLVTPAHIVPEWYFTPFYAILRACPNKLGGAIGMFLSILLLFAVPAVINFVSQNRQTTLAPYSDAYKLGFWFFIGIFFTLIFLGSNPAAAPYVLCSKFFTIAYFVYFLVILSHLSVFDRLSYKKSRYGFRELLGAAVPGSTKKAEETRALTSTKDVSKAVAEAQKVEETAPQKPATWGETLWGWGANVKQFAQDHPYWSCVIVVATGAIAVVGYMYGFSSIAPDPATTPITSAAAPDNWATNGARVKEQLAMWQSSEKAPPVTLEEIRAVMSTMPTEEAQKYFIDLNTDPTTCSVLLALTSEEDSKCNSLFENPSLIGLLLLGLAFINLPTLVVVIRRRLKNVN